MGTMYYLCLHLASSRLCRQYTWENPPQGFVKVIRHRERFKLMPHGKPEYRGPYINPYDVNGELLPQYWSLPRVQDLIRTDGKQLDR